MSCRPKCLVAESPGCPFRHNSNPSLAALAFSFANSRNWNYFCKCAGVIGLSAEEGGVQGKGVEHREKAAGQEEGTMHTFLVQMHISDVEPIFFNILEQIQYAQYFSKRHLFTG